MKITRTIQGWRIEPDTSDEENALEFLFEALEATYCVPTEINTEETHTVADGIDTGDR